MSTTFFTDRDLGNVFPDILDKAGLTVERHRDHFAHDAADVQWLEEVARREWVALTHNKRIRYTPNEKEAVMRSGARLLVIMGDAPHPELARSFVATAQAVEQFLDGRPGPFIAKVYRPTPSELAKNPAASGRVELWCD